MFSPATAGIQGRALRRVPALPTQRPGAVARPTKVVLKGATWSPAARVFGHGAPPRELPRALADLRVLQVRQPPKWSQALDSTTTKLVSSGIASPPPFANRTWSVSAVDDRGGIAVAHHGNEYRHGPDKGSGPAIQESHRRAPWFRIRLPVRPR
jgi:hypothetical protein